MRILFYSKAGHSEALAQAIAREHRCTSDQIPPAYPCEGEKLLMIGLESAKKPDKQVVAFCQDLTPERAKNVAFYVAGDSTEVVEPLKEIVKQKGLNVVGDTYHCHLKTVLFSKKLTEADIQGVKDWAKQVVDSLIGK